MSSFTKTKNLEIECLRGMAVLLTMFAHLPILLPFHGDAFIWMFFNLMNPWTGVDLFFCISGYVVSKAYMESFDQHRQRGLYWVAAQGFFIRRVFRLLPSAWLWAIFGLLSSIYFNSTGVFSTWLNNLRSLAVIFTFTGNYANQHGLLLHPNDIYWSLALEEQFYFLFPIFLFVVKSMRWRIGVLIFFVAVQFVTSRNPFGSPLEGMLASFRLDAIMWGVLIYLFSRTPHYRYFEPTFLRSKVVSFMTVAVLLYLLVAIPGQLIKMPISVGLIAVVTALLVFISSFSKGYIFTVPIFSRLMIWMGARSYGIYLIHIVVYRWLFEGVTRYTNYFQLPFDNQLTKPLLLAAFVLTLMLADLNYRLIEVPLRNFGSKIAKRKEAAFAGVVS